jgi:hypothetical protein
MANFLNIFIEEILPSILFAVFFARFPRQVKNRSLRK